MKLQFQLSGIFQRLLLNGTEVIPISLDDLIREVQAIATQNHRRTPGLIRQSFGLNFIPEPVLINLCKKSQGIVQESQLYQILPLKLLQPVKSRLNTHQVTTNIYSYQFISREANFQLTPDNPQIPIFTGNVSEYPGIYNLTIERPDYPGLDYDFAQTIWNKSRDYWRNLPDIEKIKYALQSRDLNNFWINYQQVQIWISIQELSLDLRAAITFLRVDGDDPAILSEPSRLLIQEYQSRYRLQPINLPAELRPNSTLPPKSGYQICRRQNRHILRKIINDARQFLLISSYIIEDEELTELICKKSSELPQGIWILTDLRNEVLDRLDQQILNSQNLSLSEQYQKTDERKKACLKMLLNANIPIRSGDFHLKTYISEEYAYLGSCNLTRGSLDFNLEAGTVFNNNLQHQSLINLFRYFWQKYSRDEVIAESNIDGFRLRSLFRVSQEKYANSAYTNFLTSLQYQKDLIANLQNFQGQVKIYSRSFQPSLEIATYLKLLDTRIFIASGILMNNQNFNIQRIDYLHAKVTILGNEIAYIGGIDFNFSDSRLHDLMYKTTNAREINQIASLLSSLH